MTPRVCPVGPRPASARRLWKMGAALLVGLAIMTQPVPAAAWPTQPQTPAAIEVRPNGGQGSVPLIGVGRVDSTPGESRVAFLKRVGLVLSDFTTATGFEACAAIGERAGDPQQPGRFVAPIVTNGSHLACTPDPAWLGDVPDSGETIHSHPSESHREYRINAADKILIKITQGKTVRVGERMRHNHAHSAGPFSPSDRTAGPGWVVVDDELFHQDGKTTTPWGSIRTNPIQPTIIELGRLSSSGGRQLSYWDMSTVAPMRIETLPTQPTTPASLLASPAPANPADALGTDDVVAATGARL